MYVFYPADELLRIYENSTREFVSLTVNDAAVNVGYEEADHYYQQQSQQQAQQQQSQQQQSQQQSQQQRVVVANDNGHRRKKEKKRESSQTPARRQNCAGRNGSSGAGGGDNLGKKGRREEHHAGTMQNNRAAGEEAANPLKDLTQPSLNEPLKQHNGVSLKLVQTGKCCFRLCTRAELSSSLSLPLSSFVCVCLPFRQTRLLAFFVASLPER